MQHIPEWLSILPALMTAIGKENIVVEIILFVLILAMLGYAVYYTMKNNKPTLHMIFMSAIFILIGFTTFSMVIIRANQNPPMNENEPNTFPKVRDSISTESSMEIFQLLKEDLQTNLISKEFLQITPAILHFFYDYQMNHMMTRYWLWNYAGREGWVQDDGANIAPFNFIGNIFGKDYSCKF
ncbi:MAG: hypothetical protein MZV64_72085 [Ignavibacteriales bacterium]|nr:hypothetical protein [Ignavibacteriales bacterium]